MPDGDCGVAFPLDELEEPLVVQLPGRLARVPGPAGDALKTPLAGCRQLAPPVSHALDQDPLPEPEVPVPVLSWDQRMTLSVYKRL